MERHEGAQGPTRGRWATSPRVLVMVLAVVALLAAARPARAGADWDPDRTWVFVVGLLEWEDSKTYGAFPKAHRRDAQLARLFREAGVASDHLVYLQDRAATSTRIQRSLADLLARTRPGDLLIVYYAGHGSVEDGRLWFASWDASADDYGWDATAIPDVLDRQFRGSRVMLLADTCHSGALAAAVKKRSRRAAYAVLTSTTGAQESTENWTFTEAVLDAFRGQPWADADGDGAVVLDETARLAREDMAFAEQQSVTYALVGGFPGSLQLAAARRAANPRVGERVLVHTDGDWWKARVIAVQGAQLKVHYFGYDHTEDALVRRNQVRLAGRGAAAPSGVD